MGVLWNRNVRDSFGPFHSHAKTTWLFVDRRSGNGLVKKFTALQSFAFTWLILGRLLGVMKERK